MRAIPSIPRSAAVPRPLESPATRAVSAWGGRGQRVQAALRYTDRQSCRWRPRSATGLWAADPLASAPAPRFAGATRPRPYRGSRRDRSRQPQSRVASAHRVTAPTTTRPCRGGGDGDTKRHRRLRDRHRAPRLSLRPVPRARRRFARPAGIRLRKSTRVASCRRARGPACSSRRGCTRGPSLAAAAR